MSAEDASPHSWHDLYEEASAIASTPSKSSEGPGGVGTSAQRTPERPPPSVREIVVVDDVFVLFMESDPGVSRCGGKIGATKRFCTAECLPGTEACRYASHSTKVSISTPAYFIRTPKGGQSAYCEPCLMVPSRGFSDPVVAALRGKRTTSEWTKLFPVLASAASMPTDHQMDLIARGERNVTVGPTPAKRKVWSVESDAELATDRSVVDPDDPDESLTLSQFYKEARLPSNDGTTPKEQVQHMIQYWDDMVLSTEIYRTKIKDMDLATAMTLEEIDDKVVQVAAMLGAKPEGDLPLTAWSAIAAVTEGSVDTKKEVDAKMEYMVDCVTGLQHTLDVQVGPTVRLLSNAVKKLQSEPLNEAGLPGSRREAELVKELGELKLAQRESVLEISALKSGLSSVNGFMEEMQRSRPSSDGMPVSAVDYNRAMDDMRSQIYQVRRHVDNIPIVAPAPARTAVDSVNSDVAEEMASLRDAVAVMTLELRNMKAEIVSDSITFGGHYFMAPDSYILFVTQHFPKGQLQFMMDFVSFMECATNRNKNTSDQLKVMKAIAGAGFKDQGTNHVTVYASFGTLIPTMFGTECDATDPSKKMGSMKDMKEWDPMSDRHGRKNTIATAVAALRRSMDLQITSSFGQASVAAFFFKELLATTCAFWESFAAWVTRFENEMVSQMSAQQSVGQKASIWNLVCWLIHSMFSELEVRRSPGLVAHDLEQSKTVEIAGAILEGTLKAHKFMKELTDAQFHRHPLFSAMMSEFMMTSKASNIALEEVAATAKTALVGLRALQSGQDKAKGGKRQAAGEN